MRMLMLCLVAVSLAACTATAAQQESQKIAQVSQISMNNLKACIQAANSKPQYLPIIHHITTPDNPDYKMAELTDDTKPTKAEAQLLMALHDDKIPCKKVAMDEMWSVTPSLVPIMNNLMTRRDEVMLRLVKRQITWGQAAQEDQRIVAEMMPQFAAASVQIKRDLDNAHQTELAQRQAESDAMMQWYMQQEMIRAMNRPQRTRCHTHGSHTDCVTK